MRFHDSFRRSAGLVLLFCGLTGSALAQSVQANVNGSVQTIGNLNASNGYENNDPSTGSLVMTGSLFLNSTYKYLMNDAMGCQFRWFQIVTADSAPPNWMGSAPTVPYVDPPFDGWDYQRSPKGDYKKGTPGDDELPFYENNAEYAKDSEAAGSGGLGHNATQGISRIFDGPGLPKVMNGTLQFQTYLVFVDTKMIAAKTFVPLLGYSWGGGYNGAATTANITFNGPTYIQPANFDKDLMVKALGNDGFGGSTPTFGANIDTCQVAPEPASFLPLAGAALLCLRRRKKSC